MEEPQAQKHLKGTPWNKKETPWNKK